MQEWGGKNPPRMRKIQALEQPQEEPEFVFPQELQQELPQPQEPHPHLQPQEQFVVEVPPTLPPELF